MTMESLIKSPKIWILIIVIFIAALIVTFQGINLGIDFEGGTMFQIHLAKVPKNISIEEITNTIERRLNWSGLQDIRVYSIISESSKYAGYNDAFVFVVVRKSKPADVARIESLLRKQGKFEALIDGNVLFTGKDIVAVDVSPGYDRVIKVSENSYKWVLPFQLSYEAAVRFRDLTFHKCTALPGSSGKVNYKCKLTYFFIDRPSNYLIIVSKETLERDKVLFLKATEPVPRIEKFDEFLENLGAKVIIVDKNALDIEKIKELSKDKFGIIVDGSLNEDLIKKLKDLNTIVKIVKPKKDIPWFYEISGLRTTVRLTPSVTGLEPYVERKEDAKIITDLLITGYSRTEESAKNEREELKILLNSGSLPVAVESISKYTVSPTQGMEFFKFVAIILIIVLFAVSLFIFLRYKHISLSAAIIFTALVEAFVTTAFTSFLGQSIDVSTITGIIAAVGTGVDDQIVITDELLLGGRAERKAAGLIRRIKRAFFIVFGSAFTTLATMFPIILFGAVLIKIIGFAIAITIGVLVGVLVTRPSYAEIAKEIISKSK